MSRIDIQHLEIRLRNISAEQAGSIVDGLSESLLNQLEPLLREVSASDSAHGDHRNSSNGTNTLAYKEFPIDVIETEAGSDVREIRNSITRSISRSIADRFRAGEVRQPGSGIRDRNWEVSSRSDHIPRRVSEQ